MARCISRGIVSLALLLALGGASLGLVQPASVSAGEGGDGGASDRIGLQLLAINDFHGGLESRMVSGRPAGGAAVLAAYLDQAEREASTQGEDTLRVGAGDLIGGSPPISGLLQDEPTIQAMDLMHIQLSSVGNHEFDEGLAELQRLQNGGCHPKTGCFAGASELHYLAANVVSADNNQPIFPPYAVESVRGMRVGFIGVVLKDTPTIVTPDGVAGLRFLDEVETINHYVGTLRGMGIEAIVVLIHQGGSLAPGGQVDGGPISGDIVPIVQVLDPSVDVVVSGHTHQGYQTTINGMLVTQAFSGGTAYADIDLTLDRVSGDVVDKHAQIVTTFADVPPGDVPNPELAALVDQTRQQVAPIIDAHVADAAHAISAQQNAAGESALGDLIADAQRASMTTQVAFMNPGGIRADLPDGNLTYGDFFTVQPFGNDMVKLTLTGAQLEQLLEQQWSGGNQANPRMLQVSGLTYTSSPAADPSDRVQPTDILVGGQPLDPTASYTVAVNSFLSTGGDNFTVLKEGTDRVVGPTDLDALIAYSKQLPQPIDVSTDGRIATR